MLCLSETEGDLHGELRRSSCAFHPGEPGYQAAGAAERRWAIARERALCAGDEAPDPGVGDVPLQRSSGGSERNGLW